MNSSGVNTLLVILFLKWSASHVTKLVTEGKKSSAMDAAKITGIMLISSMPAAGKVATFSPRELSQRNG
jgi:hypothetical protein